MLERRELANKLRDLIHLDMDAVEAYKQALDKIDDTQIHRAISEFRDDHVRHISDLSSCLSLMGEEVPEYGKDVKGYFIEGMTALRSMTGTKGALKAMKMNEGLTNTSYSNALSWDCSAEVKEIIERNFRDEQRHLQYIEDCLNRLDRTSSPNDFQDYDDRFQPRA